MTGMHETKLIINKTKASVFTTQQMFVLLLYVLSRTIIKQNAIRLSGDRGCSWEGGRSCKGIDINFSCKPYILSQTY